MCQSRRGRPLRRPPASSVAAVSPDKVLEALGADPATTALLFDFDGTLSPIVDDPEAAAAAPGAVELLDRLAARYRRVAAVSGRPRAFLASRLGAGVDLSGLYGLETRTAGIDGEHAEAAAWRSVVADVVARATGAATPLPAGVFVEPKGLSITVHWRRQPDAEAAVRAWADEVGERTGLEVRDAKASVELHPPIDSDKGTSVRALADGCSTVAYFGDDLGDLPAFHALDVLAAEGVRTVSVAVAGDELPPEVGAAADLVVDDPAALVALLTPLAPPG